MTASETRGVYAAVVTPRRKTCGEIDIAAGLELVDFLENARVDGILLLGTTGEFVHFLPEERARYASMVIKRSRIPITVNASHSTLEVALELGQQAAAAGAAGVVVMPPYFFEYTQPQVRTFFQAFADGMAGRVPLYLYNIPFFTTAIGVETAVDLLRTGAWAGIKDSSGNWEDFEVLNRERATSTNNFSLMIENDSIFARARAQGASGVVSGCASAVPELLVGLNSAVTGSDPSRTARLEIRLAEFVQEIDRFPVPLAIREAANARGLHVGSCAIPLPPEDEAALARFREWFLDWLPKMKADLS